jgi:hypothetical protein
MIKAEKFLGSPCKYKHDGLRYKATGSCVHCALLAAAKQKHARKLKRLEDPVGQVA